MTTGTVSSASRRLARQAFREKRHADRAADAVHEEPEAEDAVDDRRDPGQVVHRNPYDPHQQAFTGVFAQVDGGDDAEREREQAHDEDQHHGTEDRREKSPFGIRLSRLTQKQLYQFVPIKEALVYQGHLVGAIHAHNLGHHDIAAAP